MAAMSLRGYCRTLIVFIACKPAMRMTKLTTIASTGRLMKRSVKDFMSILGSRIHWRRFQPVIDRYEIAARFAHPNKLLTNRLRFLATLGVLLFLDYENRISKRRV